MARQNEEPLSAKDIGARIRKRRRARGLSQKQLALTVGCKQPQISDWERGLNPPGPGYLPSLAIALGCDIEDLTLGPEGRAPAPMRFEKNPKPIRLGTILLDSVFLMIGNHTDPVEISVRYNRDWLKVPADIRPIYHSLIERAKQKAREISGIFFNGPNTRLLGASQENTRQSSTGEELKGLVLDVGPVSWEEYTVLNTFLDVELFPKPRASIRQRFGNADELYRSSPNLRWCRLANILTVLMTPITTDGYGLVQHRSRAGVSIGHGTFISGICENIHRYLDEAEPGDLNMRKTLNLTRAPAPVDYLYQPTGVPSPLLTAQRGLFEEVSEGLYALLKNTPERFKFLNIIFAQEYFHPSLVGIVELPLTSAEVASHIEETPGKDHSESTSIHFLKLDPTDQKTADFLSDEKRWTAAGLSAFITAIIYWRAHYEREN